MKTLIIKLGATGDVVRTTTLLHRLTEECDWLTSDTNSVMLKDNKKIKNVIPWSDHKQTISNHYDLVINLEDTMECAKLASEIPHGTLYGACLNPDNKITYTADSRDWFDLSLISRFGKEEADKLKMKNRKTYQEIIFKGLGWDFTGEPYYIPAAKQTGLNGDIAIAPKAGKVWPMKNWAYFDELKSMLKAKGFKVNYLPTRPTLLEHIGDIQNHGCLICGDTLPMHIALGSGLPCIGIFTCTSPWEIFDYGLLTKIVSPKLEDYFYMRGFVGEATTCISADQVFDAAIKAINDTK